MESLFGVGVLPPSILSGLPLLFPGGLALLAILTVLAGLWLVVKGSRGIGDMVITAQSIVLPTRSIAQIVRGVPNIIPLVRIVSARTVDRPIPGKLEVRYRLAGGRERRISVSMGFVVDPEAFQAELGIRGILLVGGTS